MLPVLVIDDDEVSRVTLSEVLWDLGRDVVFASETAQGLQYCRQQDFDLVILELAMPGKSSLSTIMELGKEFPALRVIAMTGRDTNQLFMAEVYGAYRTLEKPLDPGLAKNAITEVLKIHPPSEEADHIPADKSPQVVWLG